MKKIILISSLACLLFSEVLASIAQTSFSLNGILHSDLSTGVCVDKTIDLEPTFPAGMSISKVEWDYESDGIIDETSYDATNFKVSHSYPSSGIYKLTMIAHQTNTTTDTVSTEFNVKLYVYEPTKQIVLDKGDKLFTTLPAAIATAPINEVRTTWTTTKANGKDSILISNDDLLSIDIPLNSSESKKYWRRTWLVSNKCEIYVDTFNVSMNTETGIENSKTQGNTISIYPNPADDVLNVSLSKNADKIEIKDMLGNTQISEAVTEKNIPIDIKQLASGVYILNVIDNGKSYSIRFIKK